MVKDAPSQGSGDFQPRKPRGRRGAGAKRVDYGAAPARCINFVLMEPVFADLDPRPPSSRLNEISGGCTFSLGSANGRPREPPIGHNP